MAATVCRSAQRTRGSALRLPNNMQLKSNSGTRFALVSAGGSSLLSASIRMPISTFPVLNSSVTTKEKELAAASAAVENNSQTMAERLKHERKMSSAMRLYLQRKREHDMFIAREQAEFDIGTQHLANMMGLDHSSMTQADIDSSIEYLFPSGLDAEAKPSMKPPSEVFPRQKEAEFDAQGRPYQPFFYTLKPDFQNRLFNLRASMEAVTIFGERLRSQGSQPDPLQVLDESKLAHTRWITQEELCSHTLENIQPADYKEFILVLERLVVLPYSYRVRDEIFRYRVTSEGEFSSKLDIINPEYDEQGRAFVEYKGQRKTSTATVRVTKPGNGKVFIQNPEAPDFVTDITYFFALKERLQILYPLQFTKLLGLVDLDITVTGGGVSAQAGAIRYALSMCLRSFVEQSVMTDMKLNGLLTQNIRVRERKKPGKAGARKNYTWKRR